MKRFYTILILAMFSFACNSNTDKKADADSATYDKVGVPNVNGNIPDTTNAIDLTHKLDTISNKKKDSTR